MVLLAGAVTAILVHRHLHRADDFIALVRLDSRVVFPEEAPEEHLRRMYDTQCEHIDEGWTRLDVLAASASQWEATGHLAKVTEQEFYTSQIAVFEAARATC